MSRTRRCFFPSQALAGVLLLTCLAACAPAEQPRGSSDFSPASEPAIDRDVAGQVRFYVKANSSFDPWTRSPSRADQQWMRTHYFRMLVYSSYFDERLSWYPNAWVYKNAYAVKPGSPVLSEHPQWILRDAQQRKLFIPYACRDGTCPQYAADLGNPDFRAYWLNAAQRVLGKGYLGLRIDDVNMIWRVSNGMGERVLPIDPRTGRTMTLENYRRYLAEFLEAVRARFPNHEIVHNVIWYAAPLEDPQLRRAILAADYVGLQRGVSDAGIVSEEGRYGFKQFLAFVDRVHALGRAIILDDDDRDNQSERNRDYELAFYLLINSGRDMLGADGDRARMNPQSFYPGYQLNLGAARGARYTGADGVLLRQFAEGFVAVNPPGRSQACLPVPEGSRDPEGRSLRGLCLASPGGAVVLHP